MAPPEPWLSLQFARNPTKAWLLWRARVVGVFCCKIGGCRCRFIGVLCLARSQHILWSIFISNLTQNHEHRRWNKKGKNLSRWTRVPYELDHGGLTPVWMIDGPLGRLWASLGDGGEKQRCTEADFGLKSLFYFTNWFEYKSNFNFERFYSQKKLIAHINTKEFMQWHECNNYKFLYP
jgi:hypothetical protein